MFFKNGSDKNQPCGSRVVTKALFFPTGGQSQFFLKTEQEDAKKRTIKRKRVKEVVRNFITQK
jgi:hypothetical protein